MFLIKTHIVYFFGYVSLSLSCCFSSFHVTWKEARIYLFPQRKQLFTKFVLFVKSAFSKWFIFRERTFLILILMNVIREVNDIPHWFNFWLFEWQEQSPKVFSESCPEKTHLCLVSLLIDFAGCNWSLQLYPKEALAQVFPFSNSFLISFSE